MNNMLSKLSTLSVYDSIREDNINLYRKYNMLAKQGMSKKQTCLALKIKPGTIDSIRKTYHLQHAYYFVQKRKKYKKKMEMISRKNQRKSVLEMKNK